MVSSAHPVPDAVTAAVAVAGWPGIVLPRRRIGGYQLYPVVEVNEPVWRHRLQQGHGPEYVLSTLYLWESWSPDLGSMPPAPAVSIVGMVTDAVGARQARYGAAVARSLGAGLVIAAGPRGPSPITVMECDMAGVGLVWVNPGGPVQQMVAARMGSVATARRSHITRYFEELLFGWALHAFEPQTYAPPSRLPLD